MERTMKQRSSGREDEDAAGLAGGGTVRVLLVDDHPVFRRVLRDLVAATPGFTVVGEAACGEEALAAIAAVSPEFVVMDVRMPRLGGLQAARCMMKRNPNLVILLISAQELPDLSPPERSDRAISLAQKWELRSSLLHEVWEGRPEAQRP